MVVDISETFGTYFAVNAGAAATKAVEGQAMTKGEVSLSLTGKGRDALQAEAARWDEHAQAVYAVLGHAEG